MGAGMGMVWLHRCSLGLGDRGQMRLGARYGQGDWLCDVVGSGVEVERLVCSRHRRGGDKDGNISRRELVHRWAISVWLVDELAVRYSRFGSVYRQARCQ